MMVSYRHIQKIDFFRNFFTGAIIPILEVVLMLIFIKSFQAGVWEKTTLTVIIKSSYIIGIPLSIWVFRCHFPINQVLFIVCLLAGGSLWLSAYVGVVESLSLWVRVGIFLFLVAIVGVPFNGFHGLLSEFYNYYPRGDRGKIYVTSNIALFIGGTFFAIFYDFLIGSGEVFYRGAGGEGSELNYGIALWVAGGSLVIAALFSRNLPQITFTGGENLSFRNWFKILKEDFLFTYVLIAWFLHATASLWLVSYRTNLLVEDKFGFSYDESTVFLLIVVVPQVTYLIFNYPFALLFDHYNVIVVRIVINIFMGLYIIFFFMSYSFYGQLLGAFFYGIFASGGNLAWKLWIYKVVPSDKVSTYMNIQATFTGFRMMVVPAFGLVGLYSLGPVNAAWISLIPLVISIGMLCYLIPTAKKKFIY